MIVKDGIPLIVVPMLIGLIGGWCLWKLTGCPCVAGTLLGVCVVFALFMVWFFRNPTRTPPPGEENIVSGAEGTCRAVQYVEETTTMPDGSPHPAASIVKEFFPGQRAVRISTFLSPLHVHVNRLSIGGTVKQLEYRNGKHFLTPDERSSLYNQCSIIVVEDDDGLRCLHKQITGPVVRRVVYWLTLGQKVERGGILGMMKFGSRMDIWLPADRVDVVIKPGEPVRAGETIIAKRRKLSDKASK